MNKNLDREIYLALLEFDADETELCAIVQKIKRLNLELNDLETRRINLRHKMLDSLDILRELFKRKITCDINKDDFARIDKIVSLSQPVKDR